VSVRASAARRAALVILHRAWRSLERMPVGATPNRRAEAASVDLVCRLRVLSRVPQRRELWIISDGCGHVPSVPHPRWFDAVGAGETRVFRVEVVGEARAADLAGLLFVLGNELV